MPTRSARTLWAGGLQDGTGQVELVSSGAGKFDVTFPRRVADAAEGTSPEELIGAAHSSCYSMALSAEIANAGGTPESLDVTADVTLGPDPAGGFRISKIKLTVRAVAPGLDAEGFYAAAVAAKNGCPVSKALAGVAEVELDAEII
ncbi:OsmC family peroxiredoxin [Nocardia asteroides]|uniref:Hydroperoxide peroxidase OsmC n=1 Tax=Nocardia asteroides NBRC 15531 TaxID=1110697 RepID=U5EHN0_NOCAS|nr:OsmC family peroxiredoxin [Nocardia asteroides]TLF62244.1 OsmC family peroxiredoxin [Nocardia asteroides NBRC 15531]UGT48154.1 OsmC family peroxiredoxin [Nocardia asteroides]SFN70406.1 osmotically inducible protein OsmC [Nocardia asteroides]VEG32884.1 Peroxiredoxin osmC [Nocardia asteroides]GAD84634.1 hydroperoxide peroxidase OsmC [Nocardia asteroides NBRC 15531]